MFKRKRYPTGDLDAGEIILRNIAQQNLRDSFLDQYRETTKPIIHRTYKVASDEILLGCSDEDFNDPVTMKYNGKSFGAMIIASKGDGKTQLLKTLLFPQLHDKFGINIFLVDPKNDYSNLHKQMADPTLVERLKKWNIKPKGYTAKFFKPAYLGLTNRKGKEYIVTPKNFVNLEYNKRKQAWKEFLNIEEKSKAGQALEWILGQGIPTTIKGLKKLAKKHKHEIIKTRIETARMITGKKDATANMAVSNEFDVLLNNLVQSGLIGDEGTKIPIEWDQDGTPIKFKTLHSVSFSQELASRQSDGTVVLQIDLDSTRSHISSCYVKLAIADIWTDRMKYIETKGRNGVLDKPVCLVIDEADVLIPRKSVIRESPSREAVNDLLRRGRQYGWHTFCITQQPEQVSKEHINHIDYFFTTRIKNAITEKILIHKYGLSKSVVEQLRNLPYDRNSPIKTWCMFTGNPDNPIKIFKPLPPNIQIKEEKV